MYGYVLQNPVNWIDPEGLQEINPRNFFTFTTVEAAKRNLSLDQAIAAGELTRGVTLPAITVTGWFPPIIATAGTPAGCMAREIAVEYGKDALICAITGAACVGGYTKDGIQGVNDIMEPVVEKREQYREKTRPPGFLRRNTGSFLRKR